MGQPIDRDRAVLIGVSAVAFSITTIMRRLALGRAFHPLQYEAVAGSIHALLIPAYLSLIWRANGNTLPWDARAVMWTLLATVINTAGTIAFLFAVRQHNDVGFVSSLAGASPIVTLLLSVMLLGERLDARQAIGIAIVLLGVVIASGR